MEKETSQETGVRLIPELSAAALKAGDDKKELALWYELRAINANGSSRLVPAQVSQPRAAMGKNSHRGPGSFFGRGDTMDSQKAKVAETMAHHKVSSTYNVIFIKKEDTEPYAVPLASKTLSKADYCRHYDDIRELLKGPLSLSNFERDVAFQLIRFGVYYGRVYPKASTLADQCQVSKRAVWRAIARLRGLGVIKSYPVFINGYQTSSWYRMDKLFLMMAQFIAERGRELNRQAIAILRSFNNFWHQIWHAEVDLVDEQAPVKLKLPLTKG